MCRVQAYTVELNIASEQFGALDNAADSNLFIGAGLAQRSLNVEAAAIVFHDGRNYGIADVNVDLHTAGVGMLQGIVQELLNRPENDNLDVRGQAPVAAHNG